MCFNDGAGDRESQAGATSSLVTSRLGSVEAVEDPGQIGRIDANPVINDRDGQGFIGFHTGLNYDVSVGLHAVHRISNDVAESLAHPAVVELELRQVRRNIERQQDLASLGL